jgi:acetyltransferase-like isoleucine patch superfamily enzyme
MEAQQPYRKLSGPLSLARDAVRALRLVRHKARLRGKLVAGSNVQFGPGALLSPPTRLEVGNNFATGADLHVSTNLVVGDDVLISSKVAFVGNDHRIDLPEQTVFWSGRLPENTVYLEGDNLIGYGTIVVGNVRIGRGAIVGAGSVVTRDLPPYTICAGVPARVLKPRFPDSEEI